MATVLVWSERNDPNSPGGVWRDCMYSSGLMALVFGGKASFPLGFYSVGEREALERADNQPDETGASLDDLIVAVKNRYGITITKSLKQYLADKHARADLGFVITGSNGNLPVGHTLRRWDPTFTGGHAVFIVPTGDGTHVKWYDPEATMKYAGDTTDWATVMKWIGTMPYFIMVRRDAFAPAPPPIPPTPAPLVYTEAQMKAVRDELDAVKAELATAQADATQLSIDKEKLAAALAVSEGKITAAKNALN